jgi:hypothetical protein
MNLAIHEFLLTPGNSTITVRVADDPVIRDYPNAGHSMAAPLVHNSDLERSARWISEGHKRGEEQERKQEDRFELRQMTHSVTLIGR